MFMKMARECPDLIGRHVTRIDCDLVFTKSKPKSERRLDFAHFLDALLSLAIKRYPDDETKTAQRKFVANQLKPLHAHVIAEAGRTSDSDHPLTGAFRRLYDVRKCVRCSLHDPSRLLSPPVVHVCNCLIAVARVPACGHGEGRPVIGRAQLHLRLR